MSLTINTNLAALNAARNLSTAHSHLGKSVQRLSSGLRVNEAADDAAGLGVRELMRAEIASMHQGARNISDAISLIQTVDGALGIIDEKLIRMNELAQQSATGTYSADQRLMIESEYQAMAREITRIARSTRFNGRRMLDPLEPVSGTHDGSGLDATGAIKVHFGSSNDSAEDYYYIEIGGATSGTLGVGPNTDPANKAYTISTQAAAQQALEGIKDAIVSKDTIRAHLGAVQNRLENTLSNLRIQAENLQAAESRISDIDISQEMTRFVRTQILTQAATAMLSQANSLPGAALRLISG